MWPRGSTERRRKLGRLTRPLAHPLRFVPALFGVWLACVPDARANGRFPNAQMVRELGPESLVIAGTYGLLLTTNGGKDFAYVCETEMFGRSAGGFTLDPLLEVAPDGAFVTGSVEGARVSVDGGCGFEVIESLPRNYDFFGEAAPDGAESGRVVDVCRRGAGADAPLVALVAIVDAAGIPVEHRVYEAVGGTEFVPLGAPLAAGELAFATTIDVAPSDPERFYVTGMLEGSAVLARSHDGGARWETVPIAVPEPNGVLGTYLGAVAPNDPERLYVRVSRRRLTEASYYVWDDSLLASDDAGNSFSEVLRKGAALLGFAVTADGATILAGYGDPRADAALALREERGLYAAVAAPVAELSFERIVAELDVSCLYAGASGLFTCAAEEDPLGADSSVTDDFHLGVYRGGALPSNRADFEPLLRLRDVRGPVPNADGSPSACDAEWRFACSSLFACEDDGTELGEGALVCGDGSGGGGGEAGASAEKAAKPSNPDAGCGCRSAARGSDAGFGWLFAFLLGWWHRLRQKCRRSSS